MKQGFDDWVAGEPADPVDDCARDVVEPAWLSAPPVTPEPPVRVKIAPTDKVSPQTGGARSRRGAAVVASAAVLVAGIVTVVGLLVNSANSPAADLVTPTAEEPAVDTTWCAGLGSGAPAAVDSQDAGTAAIAAFEWAYYVLRDGARARELASANARMGRAEQISKGIQQIPIGTVHCVLVLETIEGTYTVDVFERRPDGTTEHYPQTVATATTADGTRITAITSREE
ncbi:hypothetical protein ACFYVR_26020 [Rhodococcus sp. NPDC003318]|uniref:hypothetical protein n=1 Tax=Rhodococcus sp. NPDC003318 TaxID=3364503 RepID=UPI0036C9858B